MLSVISVCCIAAAYGCADNGHTEHDWVENGETDKDGNPVYVCSVCGETHEHTFSNEYSKDGTGHWYAATCGHSEAKKSFSEHVLDDGVCSVCGYSALADATYELQFSYYRYNEDGEIETDENSNYIVVGVTYTAVETPNGVLTSDSIQNGETVAAGDYISFTVKKSVYCKYTDDKGYPLVNANNDAITPDGNGVYSFTVTSDMVTNSGVIIIWVSNVQTPAVGIKGTGTESDPYTINSVTDWLYFTDYVNDKEYYIDLSYNTAYWELECDLDFEGEQVYMAGDGYSSDYSAFMGYFDGNGKTMSNFVVSNVFDELNIGGYAGLFGMANAYSGVPAVICNLTVKDFKVEATTPSDGACVVGGLVGYGIGFNISNCQVVNGEITVNGSSDYYSYLGGIAGILQSYLDEENGYAYYSSLQYSAVKNTEMYGTGALYGAGGLVGYVIPYAESAPVYIINNYAADVSVTGGVHTGGVAGIIDRYTTVQNTYATGNLNAASSSTSYLTGFEGTILDARYAYAGGIVGYAENDTFIGSSFFMGTLSANSSAGTSYAKKGYIYGGLSAAGYSDCYALEARIKGNLHDNDKTITVYDLGEGNLKGRGWSDADWDFSDILPTINQNESTHSFTITIIINQTSLGGRTYSIEIDSTKTSNVYVPMSYRYLLYEYGEDGGIIQYENSANDVNLRTYGYYFDADCTQRVPTCYVPMTGVTLYANYADTSAITDKVYYLTGGSSAEITFFSDGTYEYEEGAIYLTGEYEFDGQLITIKNGCFSRLSSQATDTQKQTKYTFFAARSEDGNLNIYDCQEVYIPGSSESSYDSLARFFAQGDPLVAVLGANITISGKYYAENGNVYVLNKDYTGTYVQNGVSGSLTYTVDGDGITVKVGSRTYRGVVGEDGKLTALVGENETMIYLLSYDQFEGVWEQAGIVSKIYTFDGKGTWTYTIGGAVTESGTYTVSGGEAEFELKDGTRVTVTVAEDGTLDVKQSAGTHSVGYFAENSLAGVWYTYANAQNRHTLILGGINAKGWGEASYDGEEGLRYCYSETDECWYIYYGDQIYTYFTYDSDEGALTGTFYDSATASAKEYTFYQYDVYYGTWGGSTDELSSLSFNGFGMYDVEAPAASGMRDVSGTVTIDKTTVPYTVDRTTGKATFIYNNVQYTLEYNEYTNTVSVTYADGTALLGKYDKFKDVVFADVNGVTYSFDGRGRLGAGVVTITGESSVTAKYEIADGNIIITSNGATKTISVGESGYIITDGNGASTDLYVQNPFTGAWAVYGMYTKLVIGDVRYIPSEGEKAEIAGTFFGKAIILYYDGAQMSFVYDGKNYCVSAFTDGLALSDGDADYIHLSAPDALFGVWNSGDDVLKFDGTAGSAYVTYGKVELSSGDNVKSGKYSKKISSDGIVTCTCTFVYEEDTKKITEVYTYVLSEEKSDADGVYTNGSYYLIPIEE